jgi:hypothetical protein
LENIAGKKGSKAESPPEVLRESWPRIDKQTGQLNSGEGNTDEIWGKILPVQLSHLWERVNGTFDCK